MLSCEQVEKFKLSKMESVNSNEEQKAFLKTSLSVEKFNEDKFDEDTRCGFGFLKGEWMQGMASKKTFLIVHTLTGMLYYSSWHYYTGTLTTLEKHYKFTSTQTGYIGSIYDVVATIVSLVVPYYCSKGRFPRWMGFSTLVLGTSFMIYILPYLLYGAGEDALALTEEYGSTFNSNTTQELIHQEKMKELCYANSKKLGYLNLRDTALSSYRDT